MDGNWRDLFYFNRRERNGIFVLSTLIVLLLTFQYMMPYVVEENLAVADTSHLDAYLLQLQKDSMQYNKSKKRYSVVTYKNKEPEVEESIEQKVEAIELHSFNPNLSKLKDWQQFGLSVKQSESIVKYVDKGGRFKVKEDVLKMYVIDEVLYAKMESYLLLTDSSKSDYKVKKLKRSSSSDTLYKVKVDSNILIELNLADTTELKKLRGIGSYYAKKIIKYRDQLGGFNSVNQLFEIERMREETVLSIKSKLTVDTSLIHKIHINTDMAPQMVKHPYITWNMAINIQDFRDFHKKYKSTHDLVKNGLLNEELYSKLVPYLEL